MNKFPLFFGLALLLLASSCDTTSTTQKDALAAQEVELMQKEQVLFEKEKALKLREQELLQREDAVSKIEAAAEATDFDDVALPPPTTEKEEEQLIRLGKHNITLQWIGWDNPGTANITDAGNGRYKIKGEQRSQKDSDYLLIDGTLKPVSARQLLFEGKIEYLVQFNNGGEPCIKNGPLTFRATGTRKYWRLKEKTNCEGGSLVDYVDIYF